jgi:hypothetical protein
MVVYNIRRGHRDGQAGQSIFKGFNKGSENRADLRNIAQSVVIEGEISKRRSKILEEKVV